MRYALLADIHANWPALEAVLEDAAKNSVDAYWCLGDVVGYGPNPVECVRFLREEVHPDRWVMGNHDAGLVGLVDFETEFNPYARHVIQAHQSSLQQSENLWNWCKEYFIEERGHPRVEMHDETNCVFVHACLKPGFFIGRFITSYLYPWEPALLNWNGLDILADEYRSVSGRAYLFYGHTHFPTYYGAENRGTQRDGYHLRSIKYAKPLPLGDGIVAVNPGSVGQPRDGDRRAAYAIVDTEAHTVEFRRVAYPVETVQEAMKREGYPDELVAMLWNAAGGPEDLELFATVYRRPKWDLEAVR